MFAKEIQSSEPLSLAAQVTEPAEQPFINARRELLKASFLFADIGNVLTSLAIFHSHRWTCGSHASGGLQPQIVRK